MRAYELFGLTLTFALLGCPDEAEPPEDDTSTGDDSPDDDSPDDDSPDDDSPDDDSPDDTADDTAEDSGTTGEDECVGPDGCWNCEPTEPEHLLNQCTEAQCEPFPNTPERLPLLERDGSLPPIP